MPNHLHNHLDHDGSNCISIEFALKVWTDARSQIVDGKKGKDGYYAIHLADQPHQIDQGDPVIAVTIGTSLRDLVPVILMPWHLSDQVHASMLIDPVTSPGSIYFTEIRTNGVYFTTRVDWVSVIEGDEIVYTFDNPEIDASPLAWEQMELLKSAPRGDVGFHMAVFSTSAILQSALEGVADPTTQWRGNDEVPTPEELQ